nr:unnamed protein product [Digitaria exilis]
MAALFSFLLTTAVLATVPCVIRLLHRFLWVPYRLQRRFTRQGIVGPPRRLLSGNAAEFRALLAAAAARPGAALLASFHHHGGVVARAVPHYHEWSSRYGTPFVYWFGPRPRMVVSDPEIVKAVMTDSTGAFDKSGSGGGNPLAGQLFGEGLVGLSGEKWACHRRVVAPAFNMERVKK